MIEYKPSALEEELGGSIHVSERCKRTHRLQGLTSLHDVFALLQCKQAFLTLFRIVFSAVGWSMSVIVCTVCKCLLEPIH